MKILLSIILFIFALPAFASRISVSIDDQPLSSHKRDRSDYRWVVLRGDLPAHAVAGGAENGRPLYICHANYMGAILPGKLVDGTCNVTFAGHEAQIPAFQVLVSHGDLHWEAVNSGYVPRNAVAGGNRAGRPIYICQADFAGGVHPGKVVGKKCNIGYGGREIENARFRVLVIGDAEPTPSSGGYYTSQVPQQGGGDAGYSTSQDAGNVPGYTSSQEGYH